MKFIISTYLCLQKNIETQCIKKKKSKFYNHVYELYTLPCFRYTVFKDCFYIHIYCIRDLVIKSRVPLLFYFDISCKYSRNFTLHECPWYIRTH